MTLESCSNFQAICSIKDLEVLETATHLSKAELSYNLTNQTDITMYQQHFGAVDSYMIFQQSKQFGIYDIKYSCNHSHLCTLPP